MFNFFKKKKKKGFTSTKDISGENRKIYKKYLYEVNQDKMKFIGRCGNYAYIDMHQAISSGINSAEQFIHNRK